MSTATRPHSRPRVAQTTFPSGPGFNVYVDNILIGAIGRHTREQHWWWQIDPAITEYPMVRAGMKDTKAKALAALCRAWKPFKPRAIRVKYPSFRARAQKLLKQVSLSAEDLEKAFRLTYAEGLVSGRLERKS